MYLDSSDARNTQPWAMSRGSPNALNGISCPCALNSAHPCSLNIDQVERPGTLTCAVSVDSALWPSFNAHDPRLLVNFRCARTGWFQHHRWLTNRKGGISPWPCVPHPHQASPIAPLAAT